MKVMVNIFAKTLFRFGQSQGLSFASYTKLFYGFCDKPICAQVVHNKNNNNLILLAPMGVLAHGSGHA